MNQTLTKRRMSRVLVLGLLPFLGCALFGGGTQKLHRAEDYSIKTPEGWVLESQDEESDRTYNLRSQNIVTLTSSCQRDASAHPDLLTKHLLLGARDIKFHSKEPLTIDGQEGLYSKVSVRLDKKPFEMELFVLAKEGCVFDFTLLSPHKISAKDSSEFLAFIKTFSYGKH